TTSCTGASFRAGRTRSTRCSRTTSISEPPVSELRLPLARCACSARRRGRGPGTMGTAGGAFPRTAAARPGSGLAASRSLEVAETGAELLERGHLDLADPLARQAVLA